MSTTQPTTGNEPQGAENPSQVPSLNTGRGFFYAPSGGADMVISPVNGDTSGALFLCLNTKLYPLN